MCAGAWERARQVGLAERNQTLFYHTSDHLRFGGGLKPKTNPAKKAKNEFPKEKPCAKESCNTERNQNMSHSKKGKRQKNRISDEGEPNTTKWNNSGTSAKRYGEDGWVKK